MGLRPLAPLPPRQYSMPPIPPPDRDPGRTIGLRSPWPGLVAAVKRFLRWAFWIDPEEP